MGKIKKEKLIRFILSLCASLFVWGYVTNMHNPVQTKTLANVPIELINTDSMESQNLAIDLDSISNISVSVEGRYSDIQEVAESDVRAVVDLKDLALKEGDNTVNIQIESLNPLIRILDKKSPNQTKLNVAKLFQKEFPVKISSTGSLPDGYSLGEGIPSKSTIIATGTKESLSDIKHIAVTVDLTDVTSDINGSYSLKAINKLGEESNAISLKDKEIAVQIPVFCSKTVPVVLDIKGNPSGGYTVAQYSTNISSLTIMGAADIINPIVGVYTEPVDLSGVTADIIKTLKIQIPKNVSIKDNISEVVANVNISRN